MRLQEFDRDIRYRDSTAPLRPYGVDSVEQLYEASTVAVTTKLKTYLKSVMPMDDQKDTEEGVDEKHGETREGGVSGSRGCGKVLQEEEEQTLGKCDDPGIGAAGDGRSQFCQTTRPVPSDKSTLP
jgi:hypothetical protein